MTNRELAYTYMVLYLAEKYTKHGYLKSNQIEPAFTHIKLIKFNIQNDYSQRKCDLFPFLVAIGNGHKKELLDFWGDFIPLQDGFILLDLKNSISSKLSEVLDNPIKKIIKFNPNSLIIDTDFITYLSNLKSENSSISLFENMINYFSTINFNIEVTEELRTIINRITKSIDYIYNVLPGLYFTNRDFDFISNSWVKNSSPIHYRFKKYFNQDTGAFSDISSYKQSEKEIKEYIKDALISFPFDITPKIEEHTLEDKGQIQHVSSNTNISNTNKVLETV